MSQAEESHTGGKKKAGYVKAHLDFWVRAFDDPGEVSWKQVSWDDRGLQRLERAIPKQRIR